ncbi:selenoprotein F [Daktulosphaira vitifoliae]|uniref:selenoprotein F n=1 Tax=Daktulosphaira vitifoliae TaxID=58002 RepID=UPI0021AABB79|nr:selenoprotein F [Daktulosphaira vitifoliae]
MKSLFILFLFFTIFLNFCIGDYTASDCVQLGFNKANLLCSSCDQLQKFDLSLLSENCLQCCQMDKEVKSIKVYAKARLEVCTCKFGAYPQIQAFLKSDRPKKYPNLTIRYVRGLDPIIKLMDNNGNVQEVLAIERWDTDTVDEFLSTHLEQVNPDEDYRSNLV